MTTINPKGKREHATIDPEWLRSWVLSLVLPFETCDSISYSGQTGGLIFNRALMTRLCGTDAYGTEITETIDALLLHELGHETASNHLDHSFHDAVCALGAKAIRLAPAIRLAATEAMLPVVVKKAA